MQAELNPLNIQFENIEKMENNAQAVATSRVV
jgi:hypothetical protein